MFVATCLPKLCSLQPAVRSFVTSSALQKNAIKQVTVIGGGLMGSGIAQVAAQTDHIVTLVDVSEEALKKSKANIEASLQRVAKKYFKERPGDATNFINKTLANLKPCVKLEEAVKDADLVVEAVVENVDLKKKLFAQIDQVAPRHTIFASNTSSLLISEIAVDSTRKDRFGGLHFFNPVPVMKLLEIVRIPETSEETYEKFVEWGQALGKTTVTCKDTPGFIVNSLLIPYQQQAARLYEQGIASPRDIDLAMKLGANYPMGPFELMDYVGLDTAKFIIDGWHKKYPDNPNFKPVKFIDEMVAQGKFGMKTGEGFYTYEKKKK